MKITFELKKVSICGFKIWKLEALRHILVFVSFQKVNFCRSYRGLNIFFYFFRVNLPENSPKGTNVLELTLGAKASGGLKYTIVEGNEDKVFEILSLKGVIMLLKKLDREKKSKYNLKINFGEKSVQSDQKVVIEVEILVTDFNDNAPIFEKSFYELILNENTSIGSKILDINVFDPDLVNSGLEVGQNDPKSLDGVFGASKFFEKLVQNGSEGLNYTISSGDDRSLFILDRNGSLRVQKILDFDLGDNIWNLTVRVCDSGSIKLCSWTRVQIILEDFNDNAPVYPIGEYLGFIGENEAVGTSIFQIKAHDRDRGIFGRINYTILEDKGLFKIDSKSGIIFSNEVFDYERQNKYFLTIKATDFGGLGSIARVRIEVEGRDEFYPQFTEKNYNWKIGSKNGFLPAGHVLGTIRATDRDKGVDGRIFYHFASQNPHFKVNRTTGVIVTKKKLDLGTLGPELSLIVLASSGKKDSLTNMTVVELNLDPGEGLGLNYPEEAGTPQWVILLLTTITLLIIILATIFTFFYLKNKRSSISKPSLSTKTDFQINLPPENPEYLPKYNDIQDVNVNQPISEISGSEQSSGRGSADDDDDIEIRMINEQINRSRSIDHQIDPLDQDNISEMSVDNTQDYLKRLGITDGKSDFSKNTLIYEDRLGINGKLIPPYFLLDTPKLY